MFTFSATLTSEPEFTHFAIHCLQDDAHLRGTAEISDHVRQQKHKRKEIAMLCGHCGQLFTTMQLLFHHVNSPNFRQATSTISNYNPILAYTLDSENRPIVKPNATVQSRHTSPASKRGRSSAPPPTQNTPCYPLQYSDQLSATQLADLLADPGTQLTEYFTTSPYDVSSVQSHSLHPMTLSQFCARFPTAMPSQFPPPTSLQTQDVAQFTSTPLTQAPPLSVSQTPSVSLPTLTSDPLQSSLSADFSLPSGQAPPQSPPDAQSLTDQDIVNIVQQMFPPSATVVPETELSADSPPLPTNHLPLTDESVQPSQDSLQHANSAAPPPPPSPPTTSTYAPAPALSVVFALVVALLLLLSSLHLWPQSLPVSYTHLTLPTIYSV